MDDGTYPKLLKSSFTVTEIIKSNRISEFERTHGSVGIERRIRALVVRNASIYRVADK